MSTNDAEGVTTSYAGGLLDRAGRLRRDPAGLAELSTYHRAEFIPLWRDRCLGMAEVVEEAGVVVGSVRY